MEETPDVDDSPNTDDEAVEPVGNEEEIHVESVCGDAGDGLPLLNKIKTFWLYRICP